MSEKRNLVLLIDSNALVHRAYHALPISMSTRSGEPTNAVYGFVGALLHALETLKPQSVVCCFDVKGGTFRHVAYDQYKAHRKEMDEGLAKQIPRIYEVIKAFGIPIVSKEGYEADDCLGTLARQYEKTHDVIILTGDKDELQLITDQTRVMMMKQGVKESVIYGKEQLHELFGLTPEEFIVYKALRGDPSDNIPGVGGVGDITAQKLVQHYHTLENLYAALDEPEEKHPFLKGKLRERLITDKEQAFLSEKLSTIDLAVPLDEVPHINDGFQAHIDELNQIFSDLEFRTFGTRVAKLSNVQLDLGDDKAMSAPYEMVDQKALLLFLKHLDAEKTVALSVAIKKDSLEPVPHFLAVASADTTFVTKWDESMGRSVATLLMRQTGTCVLWDTKLYMRLIKELRPSGCSIDLMIIEALLQQASSDMGNVVIKKESDQELCEMLAVRARTLFENTTADMAELDHAKMTSVWEVIEQPLIHAVAYMERNGVRVDEAFLTDLALKVNKKLSDLEKEIWHQAGQEFNVASPQQLSVILFEKLQLKTSGVKKKATGLSTDVSTLEALRGVHPIIELILQYRELAKLKGTYIDALPRLINQSDSRVHATFNQIGAATGRLSSTDPNLQNIPIRTEAGNEIRKSFVASDGNVLISLDYSQFELRIMAHLSGDEAMQESFRSGIDIHTATAARLHEIPAENVTKEMRRAAKAVNFGILYGLSAHSLAKQLGIDYKQAQEFIDRYFASYPRVKEYLNRVIEEARTEGCYYTLFGRRRLFPELTSPVWAVRQAGERMVMNFPMQGTQADILKIAMTKVWNAYKDDKNVRMILSVHDELVFEVERQKAQSVGEDIKTIMQKACELSVPIEVSCHIGKSWGDMESLEVVS